MSQTFECFRIPKIEWETKIMKQINTILPPVIPACITPQNASLHGVIENAIASSQLQADHLSY